MKVIALTLAISACMLVFLWTREVDVERRIRRVQRLHMPDFCLLDLVCVESRADLHHDAAEGIYLEMIGSAGGLRAFVRDGYYRLQTAHALLLQADITQAPDAKAIHARIEHEFIHEVVLYWFAALELLVGRLFPSHYYFGRRLVCHYREVVVMTAYLCDGVRPDLTPGLEG